MALQGEIGVWELSEPMVIGHESAGYFKQFMCLVVLLRANTVAVTTAALRKT